MKEGRDRGRKEKGKCGCCLRVSVAVMKYHGQQQLWEEKVYFTLAFTIKSSQDRNSSRAGIWRQELMQRPWRVLLTGLLHMACFSLLSYRAQNHQPRDGPTHNGLAPLPSITN